MTAKTFSIIISRIFDFYFWFPVILILAVFNSGMNFGQIRILLPILFVFDIALPIGLFFKLLASGKISDIDVTRRSERHRLTGGVSLIFLVSTIISYLLGNQSFFILHLAVFLMGLTIFLITLYFKISGHLFINAGAIFLLNFLYDWKFTWLFAIIPFLGFARIYLKKHTLAEVLAGAAVGLTEPYLIFKFFRLM